jgi:hypothetical protein
MTALLYLPAVVLLGIAATVGRRVAVPSADDVLISFHMLTAVTIAVSAAAGNPRPVVLVVLAGVAAAMATPGVVYRFTPRSVAVAGLIALVAAWAAAMPLLGGKHVLAAALTGAGLGVVSTQMLAATSRLPDKHSSWAIPLAALCIAAVPLGLVVVGLLTARAVFDAAQANGRPTN